MTHDEKLLLDVLARDRCAWRTLVTTHEAALRRVIREAASADRSLADDEIDDVLGDLWLLLLEDDLSRLRGFQRSGGSDLGAWLALIADEVTRKELRRRRRAPELVTLDESLENRIAAAVIRGLGGRGMVAPHDQAVPSPGTAKEATCPDDETNKIGYWAPRGSQAGPAGESSFSRQLRRTRRKEQFLDTIAKRMKQTTPQ